MVGYLKALNISQLKDEIKIKHYLKSITFSINNHSKDAYISLLNEAVRI